MMEHGATQLRERPAFTLVELLVVLAIIALLASMLLPALAKSKQAGQRTVCESNQRQLAIASMAYSLDNADWLNPLQTAIPNSPVETTYRVILWDYVAHMRQVFDCPAEINAVYADGISAYDASYGDFAFAPGTNWSRTGIGVAGPYEKWNQSGIGVAGAHWIHIDGKANYAFADGHLQLLNANDIRCDTGECGWSVDLSYHQTTGP
jgi:prepilin-type N-terminal cleavage/methylation domain-containing protein/prepilin-type processing-associated H-X9-DG protein